MFSSVGSLSLLVVKASTMLALSAVVVAAMIRLLRFSSPRVERVGWFCVLVQGILLVHLPLSIPWYMASVSEPSTPSQTPTVASDAPPPAPGSEMQEETQDASLPGVTASAAQPALPVAVSRTTWSKANAFLYVWLAGIAGLIGCAFYRYVRFVRQLSAIDRENELWRPGVARAAGRGRHSPADPVGGHTPGGTGSLSLALGLSRAGSRGGVGQAPPGRTPGRVAARTGPLPARRPVEIAGRTPLGRRALVQSFGLVGPGTL